MVVMSKLQLNVFVLLVDIKTYQVASTCPQYFSLGERLHGEYVMPSLQNTAVQHTTVKRINSRQITCSIETVHHLHKRDVKDISY